MQRVLMIISYASLLLLTMAATRNGLILTGILFVLGSALIILKKPKAGIYDGARTYLPAAAIYVFCIGAPFYDRWLPSSKVRIIAAMLRVPNNILIIFTYIFLSVCSCLFVLNVSLEISGILSGMKDEEYFKRNLLGCLIASFITFINMHCMIKVAILSMGVTKFICNILIIYVVIAVLYGLTGRIKASIVLGTGFFILNSAVNVYVFSFRGRLFEPVDIFSFLTALSVVDNYSFVSGATDVIIGCGIWIWLIVFIFTKCKNGSRKPDWRKRGLLLLTCMIIGSVILGYAANLETSRWDKEGAIKHGCILDFISKIKEMNISKPEGYSEGFVADMADRYTQADSSNLREKQPPHIIVIMDEAFSDLSVIGDISVDKEVLPFIASLKQNTVSGYALTSVLGGNTANSEYEFLTGNSMAWLAPKSSPFSQYIVSPSYSMPHYLKSHLGYRCIAMHPYLANGWNRPMAYKNLGFDQCFFLEDFPQKDYIREYTSDREMFEKLVDVYESSNQQPLFILGVSMQNHGGYDYSGDNYSQSVSLVGYDREYNDVEQYLSLIHETDKAVEYLISYFSEAKEDVVIVFFGDHQPHLDNDFYNEIGDNEAGWLEKRQSLHKVPFFVWANYDIEEKQVELTSLNYLSSYVYEAAGIHLPPYNLFLSDMEKVIPAINANGFYSLKLERHLPFDKASEEEKIWLDSYARLQYNSIADADHRNEKMFPLSRN